MKFKLTIGNLLLLLLIIIVLVVVFKIGQSESKSERKQEISVTGVSTKRVKEISIIYFVMLGHLRDRSFGNER